MDIATTKRLNYDHNISNTIFEALTSPDSILSNEDKLKYMKFLTDFYVSKSFGKQRIFGFLTGREGALTHGVSDLPF